MTAEDRLDALADHILVHGLGASSLRPLAQAAGLSDRMLLYHFKDKAEVITASLAHLMARFTGLLAAGTAPVPLPTAELQARLAAMVSDDAFWPYLRLWLEIASLAARGDAFYRAIGGTMGRGFLAWAQTQLAEPDPTTRATIAARLFVMTEGLVVLKSVGLDDVCHSALPLPDLGS